jgi:hypothetical protein
MAGPCARPHPDKRPQHVLDHMICLNELRLANNVLLQVTARADDSHAAPKARSPCENAVSLHPIASARVLVASPTGGNGVRTAVLVDVHGHAAGKVTS